MTARTETTAGLKAMICAEVNADKPSIHLIRALLKAIEMTIGADGDLSLDNYEEGIGGMPHRLHAIAPALPFERMIDALSEVLGSAQGQFAGNRLQALTNLLPDIDRVFPDPAERALAMQTIQQQVREGIGMGEFPPGRALVPALALPMPPLIEEAATAAALSLEAARERQGERL